MCPPKPALRGAGEGVVSMNEDSEALLIATSRPVDVDVNPESLPYGFSDQTCQGLWGPLTNRSKKVAALRGVRARVGGPEEVRGQIGWSQPHLKGVKRDSSGNTHTPKAAIILNNDDMEDKVAIEIINGGNRERKRMITARRRRVMTFNWGCS